MTVIPPERAACRIPGSLGLDPHAVATWYMMTAEMRGMDLPTATFQRPRPCHRPEPLSRALSLLPKQDQSDDQNDEYDSEPESPSQRQKKKRAQMMQKYRKRQKLQLEMLKVRLALSSIKRNVMDLVVITMLCTGWVLQEDSKLLEKAQGELSEALEELETLRAKVKQLEVS